MRFSPRAETQCRLSITVHTTAPNATTIDNLQPPEGKPENETIGKPILCRNSCMQLFSHECCGLSMPFGKLTLTKCTLGLLGLGALCILRLELVACGRLIDPRQPGALCFLEIRQQTRPPPYPTGPARLTNKHPISNPLVGCWRQTGLYLYPFKPSSGSAVPISRVGTSVFLFGGNQT